MAGHNPGPMDYILSDLDPRLKSLEVAGRNRFFANNYLSKVSHGVVTKLKFSLLKSLKVRV